MPQVSAVLRHDDVTDLPEFRSHGTDKKFAELAMEDLQAAVRQGIIDFLATSSGGRQGTGPTVLDFGCGRGDLVGCLRREGWRAFGIDIDPAFVKSGSLLNRLFVDEYEILSTSDEDGITLFPDEFFDIIISDQVLEHVSDLDEAASEMARLLKRGGKIMHIFPASHCLIEPHFFMPLVHWLPKTTVRKFAIKVFLQIGLGRQFFPSHSVKKRAEIIYKYSIDLTFYRSRQQIEAIFARHGIDLDFDSGLRRNIEKYRGRGGGALRLLSRIVPPYLWLCSLKNAWAIGVKPVNK
jgi:2-polyprenyl-3-methyl-5-hydroxy-6-metoxy-1,4-benzoquinol methylase